MRYQGGKTRIAKQIAEVISSNRGNSDTLVSLFCGACSVESHVEGFGRIVCNDMHEYLIALLSAVQSGYEPPSAVSEELYKLIKQNKDADKALAGFVGFGCSFGGRWFEGYARDRQGKRNFADEAKRRLKKTMSRLQNAEFTCMDYRAVELPENCVIYADPPYKGAKPYSGLEDFDDKVFWEYAREVSKTHRMFISEQKAPADFVPILERRVRRTIDVNKSNQPTVTERLFVHQGHYQSVADSGISSTTGMLLG